MITINSYSLEHMSLSNPEKVDNGLYCEVKYENEQMYIQTPKLKYSIDDQSSFKLHFENSKGIEGADKFYKMVREIENKVCDVIANNSSKWFSKELSFKTIKNDLFKTNVCMPEELCDKIKYLVNIPLNDDNTWDIEIYNKKKELLPTSELLAGSSSLECYFLLLVKGVHITSSQAVVDWELVQALIHKPRIVKKVKGFGIRQEVDEDTSPEQLLPLEHGILELNTSKEETSPKVPEEETSAEIIEELSINLIE